MDRVASAAAAVAAGAGTLILDDGFQDPALLKKLSMLVVDGGQGFGNGQMIPAGPLRETLAAGFDRADAIIVIGEDRRDITGMVRGTVGDGLPILRCRVVPGPELKRLAERPVLAFAGIGHPEKFFQTLENGGCKLAGQQDFPDHFAFHAEDIRALKSKAAAAGAVLVTTEKDRARLTPSQAEGIEVLTITLEWDDEAALDHTLQAVHS